MSDKTNERGEPDEIWLQIHGDANPADYPDGPLPDLRGDDVTWCWEPIFEHDVKYVRADIVVALDEPAGSVGGEAVELTVCCGREECGGECGNEWRGTAWYRKSAPSPAPAVVDEAMVLRACAAHKGNGGKFSLWSADEVESMRAALEAALAQPKGREAVDLEQFREAVEFWRDAEFQEPLELGRFGDEDDLAEIKEGLAKADRLLALIDAQSAKGDGDA